MEENKEIQRDASETYSRIKHMLQIEKKTSEEVVVVLMQDGMEKNTAIKLVNYAIAGSNDDTTEGDSSGAKDMVIGGLFCVGGLIATIADVGYIFWGAIVFGGFQFIKGLIKTVS